MNEIERQIYKKLNPYLNNVGKLAKDQATIDRAKKYLEYLNNPQNSYNIIHIAGTSGKTSTAYYLTKMLANNYKTGTLLSPHVYQINERFQINSQPIDLELLLNLLDKFLIRINKVNIPISYFELLTIFGFYVFAEMGCSYVVLESGIGGKYDSTNVARGQNKFCIITEIGYDHQELLGNSLEEIAEHKVGIVQAKNSLITYKKEPAIMRVFMARINKVNAKLLIADPNYQEEYSINMPNYLRRNWQLAYQAYLIIAQRDKLKTLSKEELVKSTKIYIPGRVEEIIINNRLVVLDGAHNAQKIEALVETMLAKYLDQKFQVIFAIKDSKDLRDIAQLFDPLASRLILTEFQSTPYLKSQSAKVEVLEAVFKSSTKQLLIRQNITQALKTALSYPEPILVTGSFYLLGPALVSLKAQLN